MTDSVGKPTLVSAELLSRAKFIGVDGLAWRKGEDGPRKVERMSGAKHGGERALVRSGIVARLAREGPKTPSFRETQRSDHCPFVGERDGGFSITFVHTGNAKRDGHAALAVAAPSQRL